MVTKKIKLNELRNLVKKVILEYEYHNEQQKRDELMDFISDLHKDAYGFRPDMTKYEYMSIDQIEDEIERLNKLSREKMDHERNRELLNIEKLEQTIQKGINSGAEDRETALRWLIDSDDKYYDASYFLYNYGITGYTPEGIELEKEIKKIKGF